MSDFHDPQKFKVSPYLEEVELETKKMARVDKGL